MKNTTAIVLETLVFLTFLTIIQMSIGEPVLTVVFGAAAFAAYLMARD